MSKQVTHHGAEERAANARADSSMHSANATKAAIRRRRLLESIPLGLIYVFLVCMTIFSLFPIYYVIQASLGGSQNLYTTDLHILPANPTLDNYVYAFTQQPMLAWLINTLFVCGLSTLIGVVFAMTAAYALSRFRFKGRQLSLNLLLAIQAFPALLAITAYYYLLQYLNLLNTAPLLGLALIYASGSLIFSCWNIKGYFDTLPVELEQAALIDGATHTQAFLRITLPLAAPALTVTALLIFVGAWNEFPLANFVLNSNDTGSNLTFILGLFRLQGDFRTPWGYFAATSVAISLPLMIIFLYAQRFFQSGLTVGSVKG
ncbi:MAG TPA: ABC transporter permease subunit [Ktedonosporobacter sp.]|nr:ABC transporter permease subunit [Ktedonosporobacter sp.]